IQIIMHSSRRKFIRNTSTLLAGGTITAAIPASGIRSPRLRNPANEKVVVGLIGARNMGFGDLENALKLPGVECAAICDIDENILAERTAQVGKIQGKVPDRIKDFQKLLDRKEIDAVIIGTPDHWHCLPFIYACQSGKDIYVEKPLANSIGECELMVAATRKDKRVVQVGQQQRSGDHWNKIVSHIQSGKIGQLRKVKVWGNFNYGIGQPVVPDEPVPAGVDFDRWLGPAPLRSFNKSRFHGSWRMFWDYGGGLLTDWGVHLLDMALWSKNINYTPLSVTATGGNFSFPDHAHETFDTMNVEYQLKDILISWEHTAGTQQGPYNRSYGLAFIGNDATLVADRQGWEVFPESENGNFKVPAIPRQPGRDSHAEHMKNFIDCIKSRKDPNCTIENGRLVALYSHMGNIALRTRSKLEWNDTIKNFGDNRAANALIMPTYRKPWQLPIV
ncbi:MAG TPA: Gfo/Idh/MocA family oxidoreductase, partial [Flavitalea sp.]|nr:Gfo/Idh/MocA family oxidoreductase [Flavitalea sp.]